MEDQLSAPPHPGYAASRRTALYTGVFLLLFAASVLATFAVFLALRRFGLVRDPQSPEDQKSLGELAVRMVLCLSGASIYAVALARRSIRRWVAAKRWRLLFLVLFALGSLFALADPYHAISHEGNWIRYWTSGVLITAGAVGLTNALRSAHPIPDRLFGAGFGGLLILAGADEVLQFHERAAEQAGADAQGDTITLMVALAGLLGLVALFAVRRLDNWLGRLLREQRYRLPLQLLTIAVLTFLVAMTLDSVDERLQDALTAGAGAGFWKSVTDVVRLANATEELLEYFTAVALLIMVGSLFSVESLGCGRRLADPADAFAASAT